MDHVAVMKISLGFLPKILSGEKQIESRWYTSKYAPWDKIRVGETVYFKNTGEPITLKAQVSNVMQYADLTPDQIKALLEKYHTQLGIDHLETFFENVKHKKYGILVRLENVEQIPPFQIDKTGFGAMASRICVEKIEQIKARG